MTWNKVFKKEMQRYEWADTFAIIHGKHNPNKKIARKIARSRMKQNKFYNGFYEFIEENRKRDKNYGNNS